jgi:RimJ/RimL family protein N-acetyltransferase
MNAMSLRENPDKNKDEKLLYKGHSRYVLQAERLYLRKLEWNDAEAIFSYRTSPEVFRFQYWHPKTLDDVRVFIANQQQIPLDVPNSWYQMAVCRKADGLLIGDFGLHFLTRNSGQVEIGYTIAPFYQHNGYGNEVLQSVLHFLFTVLRTHKVIAHADPDNQQSIRLLKRNGFIQEAHFRKSSCRGGVWKDELMFGMLQEDYSSGF